MKKIRRFDPINIKLLNEITMDDIEQYYSTSLVKNETNTAIFIVAPLLLCMALHGHINIISYLLEKYPLINKDGWTTELCREEHITKKCFILITNRSGTLLFRKNNKLDIGLILAFSDIEDNKYKEFVSNKAFSRHQLSDLPKEFYNEIRDKIEE